MRAKLTTALSLIIVFSLFTSLPNAVALDVPGGLATTGNRGGDYNEGSVTVTWTPVSGADNGYAIQTILNGVQIGTLTGALGQSTSSSVVSGLQGGTTYSFKIRAISSTAVSEWSSAVTAMPITSPSTPTKPTHSTSLLNATARWAAPPSDGGAAITSYVVTEANSGRTQTTNATTYSAQFNDLASGTKVKFNIRAINGVTAEGTASANSDETTLPSVPSQVSGVLVAKTSTKDQLRVTWDTPGNGGSVLTGFEVFLRQSGADVQTLQVTDVAATSALFNGLSAGTYSGQVLAKNVIGSGERSLEPAGVDIEGVTPAVQASDQGGGGGSSGGGSSGGGSVPPIVPPTSPSASASPSPSASASPSPKPSPSASGTPIPNPKPFLSPSPKPSLVLPKPLPIKTKSIITAALPKTVKVSGATSKVVDSKGRVIKGIKVMISSKGKVTVEFPKGTKTGKYQIRVTTKNKKVVSIPVTLKKK
jgi:hypothetical protein